MEEIEEVFAQGHVFTAWRVKREVGKKTLDDVVGEHGHGIGSEKGEVEHDEKASA